MKTELKLMCKDVWLNAYDTAPSIKRKEYADTVLQDFLEMWNGLEESTGCKCDGMCKTDIITSTGDDRIQKAIELLVEYNDIDGAHHKDWVMDQTLRILAGTKYQSVVESACFNDENPDEPYEWEFGIAP